MPFGREVKRLRTRLNPDEQDVGAEAPALIFRAPSQAPNFAFPAHNLVANTTNFAAPAPNFAAPAPTPIAQAHNFAVPTAAQAVVFAVAVPAHQGMPTVPTITRSAISLVPLQDLHSLANRTTADMEIDLAPARPSSPSSRSSTPSL